MKYYKCRNVKSPQRANDNLSVGIDFFIPYFNDRFVEDFKFKNKDNNISVLICDEVKFDKYIIIKPQERVLIPSGIIVKIPKNYMLCAFNKSGVSSKKGLDVLASVVDPGYSGEVHINLVNTGKHIQYIYEEEKIIQFIMIPIKYSTIKEVKTYKELYPKKTIRGSGGFGSTGV